MNVVIVGLGYVGLPLALQFCRSGVNVTGLDIDATKVATLLRGEFAAPKGNPHELLTDAARRDEPAPQGRPVQRPNDFRVRP